MQLSIYGKSKFYDGACFAPVFQFLKSMKYTDLKITLLVIFLIVNLQVSSQVFIPVDKVLYVCSYLYEFQQDSNSNTSLKSQDMTLQIGSSVSRFTSTNNLYNDSILMLYSNEKPTAAGFGKIWQQVGGNTTHPFCKPNIYKNYPARNQLLFTDYLNREYLKVVENPVFNWQLKPGADTLVNGYVCHQATARFAGREYLAWFTTEIPIQEGPYKFHGLPGLIVHLRDTKDQHRFTLTSLRKVGYNSHIHMHERDYRQITAREYAKALNASFAMLYNRIQQENGLTISDDEQKARALQTTKARNNFIEKY